MTLREVELCTIVILMSLFAVTTLIALCLDSIRSTGLRIPSSLIKTFYNLVFFWLSIAAILSVIYYASSEV